MSFIFNTVNRYARFFGKDTGPAGLIENRYLLCRLPGRGVIVDVGGGDGRLAREIAGPDRAVLVLDREETMLPGADNSIYQGSLQRLLCQRGTLPITPILGDATEFPLAKGSVDAIVSSQLLEHLQSSARLRFFEECARCLKPGGVLAISTPNAEMFKVWRFRVSAAFRRLLPSRLCGSLPRSLRGPWLLQSFEEWEQKVGHFGHGCPAEELAAQARNAGLVERNRRSRDTGVTAFWLEMTGTFPLLAMLAAPLVRVLYEIEWRLPAREGINLLMTFQKPTNENGGNL